MVASAAPVEAGRTRAELTLDPILRRDPPRPGNNDGPGPVTVVADQGMNPGGLL